MDALAPQQAQAAVGGQDAARQVVLDEARGGAIQGDDDDLRRGPESGGDHGGGGEGEGSRGEEGGGGDGETVKTNHRMSVGGESRGKF